jgi:endonuclease III
MEKKASEIVRLRLITKMFFFVDTYYREIAVLLSTVNQRNDAEVENQLSSFGQEFNCLT